MEPRYKIIIFLLLITVFSVCVSCEDILEKPTSSEITTDILFSNEFYAMSYLSRVYHSLVPRGFPYTNGNPAVNQYSSEFARSILASISDEGCNVRGASWGWYVNNSGFDPNSSAKNQEDGFGFHWRGIREAYIFLENIDQVPQNEISDEEFHFRPP